MPSKKERVGQFKTISGHAKKDIRGEERSKESSRRALGVGDGKLGVTRGKKFRTRKKGVRFQGKSGAEFQRPGEVVRSARQ